MSQRLQKVHIVPDGLLEPRVHGIFNPLLAYPLPRRPPTLAFPVAFIPLCASDTPETLFAPGVRALIPASIPHHRFVRRSDPDQILLWTDGSCLQNGQPGATAGFAVKHRPSVDPQQSTFAFRLENLGPDHEAHTPTSNRAELRAVIAALLCRRWEGEGWKSLVIATDSEYVAMGATNWVKKWESNGWQTSSKGAVKNQDLWQLLLRAVRELDRYDIQILLCRIPRDLNQDADRAARRAAGEDTIEEFFVPSCIMCGFTKMATLLEPWREAVRGRPHLSST